jgi:hypothetical protein
VTEDHFNDEKHKSEKECLIRRGLLYLTDSQAALRQNDWFNLFDRAVLNEKYKLEQVSRRKTCRTSLPDSIRYSILKSDNYKCRIWGEAHLMVPNCTLTTRFLSAKAAQIIQTTSGHSANVATWERAIVISNE